MAEKQKPKSKLTKVNMEITGSLAKNPEVNYTGGGTAIARFSLVFNPFQVKDPRNVPIWINCIAFKAVAENIGLTFKAGSAVHILKATPKLDIWTGKDGKEHKDWVWTVWEIEAMDEPEEFDTEEPADHSGLDDELPY
jgi:single-stranded DNA-binding protein